MIRAQQILLILAVTLSTFSFSQSPTPCTSTCNRIVFIIDNSGSINSTEFNAMKASVDLVANSLLSNPNNEIGIVQYASTNPSPNHLYDITVPFTTNIVTATSWNRAYGSSGTVNSSANQDHLPGSLAQMRINNIWGAGMPLDLTNGCNISILLFTDANTSYTSCCSNLVNAGTFAPSALPDFQEYDTLKTTYNADFTVYHVPPNAGATQAGAAVASVGGSYTGAISPNPTDPQGSGTIPRKYYSGSFLLTQAQVDSLSNAVNQIAVDFNTAANCQYQMTNFTNQTPPGAILNWNWEFGDGNTSTAQHPSHQYQAPGTYTVSLIATDTLGCSDTLLTTLTILPEIIADFQASDSCQGNLITFQNNTVHGSVTNFANYNWSWDFGDGNTSSSQNPTHQYATEGDFDVTLSVVSPEGCQIDTTITITMHPNPIANFTIQDACFGDPVLALDASSVTSGSIINSTWTFGSNLYTTLNASHIYNTAGTHVVNLEVESNNGCTHSTSQVVNVLEGPDPGFLNLNACIEDSIIFQNNTTHPSTTNFMNFSWYWDFGDGNASTDQDPSHLYQGPGSYNVSLIAIDTLGCTDTIVSVVTVLSEIIPDFAVLDSCDGDLIGFQNNTTHGNTTNFASYTWSWDFGDGNISSLQNPTHQYAVDGNYNVTLSVVSPEGCQADTTITITIHPKPIANFTIQDACFGDSVFANDASSVAYGSIVNSTWTFGSNVYTSLNASHLYNAVGTYTVTLEVESNNGCTHSISQPVNVLELPIVDFVNLNPCTEGSTNFQNNTTHGSVTNFTNYSWSWDFGDGNTSFTQNPSHTYSNHGDYNVNLHVTAPNGCQSDSTITISTYPIPVANFIADDVCLGDYIIGQNTSTISSGSIVSNTWTFGSEILTTVDANFLSLSSGIFDITLVVESNAGCIDTVVHQVQVYAIPTADFTFNQQHIIGGATATFSNTSYNASSFNWTIDSTEVSTSEDLTHTFPNDLDRTFTVCLVAENLSNCKDSICKEVSLNEELLVFVPNSFTPDGDEFNNAWRISVTGIDNMNFDLYMYNRWGELIWESHDPSETWDGTYKGKPVQDGVYTWSITIKDKNIDYRRTYHGHVNVIK